MSSGGRRRHSSANACSASENSRARQNAAVVSHDLAPFTASASGCSCWDAGRLVAWGDPDRVVTDYEQLSRRKTVPVTRVNGAPRSGDHPRGVRQCGRRNDGQLRVRETMEARISYAAKQSITAPFSGSPFTRRTERWCTATTPNRSVRHSAHRRPGCLILKMDRIALTRRFVPVLVRRAFVGSRDELTTGFEHAFQLRSQAEGLRRHLPHSVHGAWLRADGCKGTHAAISPQPSGINDEK